MNQNSIMKPVWCVLCCAFLLCVSQGLAQEPPGGGLPVGSIVAYYGTELALNGTKWRVCRGQELVLTKDRNKNVHEQFRNVNLPNLTGHLIRGAANFADLGKDSGSKTTPELTTKQTATTFTTNLPAIPVGGHTVGIESPIAGMEDWKNTYTVTDRLAKTRPGKAFLVTGSGDLVGSIAKQSEGQHRHRIDPSSARTDATADVKITEKAPGHTHEVLPAMFKPHAIQMYWIIKVLP